jgi:hypothetical protein
MLFQQCLNYNCTDAKYIRNKVFEIHFPTKKLYKFRTWYRRKARAYGLNLELEGAREKKKESKGKWLLVVLFSAVFVVLSSCFGLVSEAADEGESSEGSDNSHNKEEDVSLGSIGTSDEVEKEEEDAKEAGTMPKKATSQNRLNGPRPLARRCHPHQVLMMSRKS